MIEKKKDRDKKVEKKTDKEKAKKIKQCVGESVDIAGKVSVEFQKQNVNLLDFLL